ncbi:DEAD/DEAH box helicase [Candidatus Thiosymbion oneisti]|uniref:DEAD/DEAH box helicase n=1 Tax=Candidatus Thiosymbion oneisti TaxID=589554 RepID=UPI000ADDAB61|nr:DEAD/DEAH box helicase [Candidatus Thiosymbion oneisti]
MSDSLFHPAVGAWFRTSFNTPSPVQAAAWPAIARGGHTLLAAPTGSGKTLAAFLAVIDGLLREGLERGLPDHTRVLYVSPLKALSTDIQLNLQRPLLGIADQLAARGLPPVEIRAWVRTGDTPQSERERMRRLPPHILVTTPESLYILLTSASGRDMLKTVRTVILDEIHALAGSKRGAHLALSLERLEALAPEVLTGQPLQRIGISATQGSVTDMAHFLLGIREMPCAIIDLGHSRPLDLGLEVPASPLEAVMAGEVWGELYDRLAALALEHRTTLIFVNTRRLAERVAHHLSGRLGEGAVMAHHGSLAREHRCEAEDRLKAGALRALVATASLELGIDIGDIDLVCQLGSPRSVAALLQRVGRSGHALAATPKGRLFPLSRDDLAECTALLAAARTRRLDRIRLPHQPLDVLAQQVVAEVAAQDWDEQGLFDRLRRAWPYRELSRATFDQVLQMLADGFSTRVGRRAAYLYRDRIGGRLRGRKGARLTAITNGGVIPDQFDYDVLLMPEGVRIGTLNEDFAFESLAGDIFQLGNTSYRILRVQSGQVLVEDARGQPPNIPFWFGEAPGRDDLLSAGVSALRAGIAERLEAGVDQARAWLLDTYGLEPAAADQLLVYYGAAQAALGLLPTQDRIVLERFFDEVGDMHLVVHSTYGSRLNRAWGLALRKRFCRTFNFELQAAALDDCIILSLGAVHSFALEDIQHFLKSDTVHRLLTQALLDVPLFGTHWRWNATTALAVRRYRGGSKVPPQFQRSAAEDLVALIFPDQLACLENIQGEREIPDHPLVTQTLGDCLTEVMDTAGLERLFARIESGAVEVIARDLAAPSPLAEEVIGARPYAFLDDTPAEERRTLAVRTRGLIDQDQAARLARPDPAAVAKIREQAWPSITDPDELHDALLLAGFLTWDELGAGTGFFARLAAEQRAVRLEIPRGTVILCATERLPELAAVCPLDPTIVAGIPSSIPFPAERVTKALLPPGEGLGRGDRDSALREPVGCGERLPRPRDGAGRPRTASLDSAMPNLVEHTAIHRCGSPPSLAAHRILQRASFFATSSPQGEGACPEQARDLGRRDRKVTDAFCDTLPADRDHALREVIRSRLECLGPVRAADLARPLDLPVSDLEQALAALEQEGFAVRGRFDPDLAGEQWCERRLLARINRYTVEGLRKAIAPVSPAAYMRFLLHWQGLAGNRVEGIEGTGAVLDRLAGFSIPAAAWEAEVLPARIAAYTPDLLDSLTVSGRYLWLRLHPGQGGKTPIRTTPIAILRRETVALWQADGPAEASGLSSRAELLLDLLQTRGARFFADLVSDSGRLRTEVTTALGELVAAGRVTADGFAGLRALIAPAASSVTTRRRRGNSSIDPIDPIDRAGRWDALPTPGAGAQPESPAAQSVRLEKLAHQLIQRYGLVMRRILERERGLPPWRELLRAYWRLEARGEVRGGRFVTGFSGEQFAHPEAVAALRRHREPGPESPVVVSATDPVNLTGVLTPGERVAAILGNRVLYRQGIPVAARINGEIRFFITPRAEEERKYAQLLTQERKSRDSVKHRKMVGRGW